MSVSPAELSAVSWRCVHFESEVANAAALSTPGVAVREITAAELTGKDELMEALSDAFSFPDYFGGNWDALDEVMRDLSWLPADGYVLVVRDAEPLWRRHPRLAGKLVRTWLTCAERWAADGKSFHLVFEW